jgi:uncharacterized protein (DUF697 family)
MEYLRRIDMDNREELLKTIEKSSLDSSIATMGKFYRYTDFPEKKKKNLLTFDKALDFDDFVAMYDTTAFGSARDGLVFMRQGFYFSEIFTRKYFNYKDIKFITVKPGKNDKPENAELIISGDEETAKIDSSFINKNALKDLLSHIKDVSDKWSNENSSDIPSGIVKGIKLSKEQTAKCHAIIHTASVAAGGIGTGLAQIPLSDNLLLAPIQITMVISIGGVFGIKVTDGMAKGILSTLAASFIGRGVSQVLVGLMPVIGNIINTATAASLTEAVGWLAVKHFQTLSQKDNKLDEVIFDIEKASKEYEKKFKKQVETFLSQKKVYQKDRDAFVHLIEDYENFVVGLEVNPQNYSDENKKAKMEEMAEHLSELKNLPIDIDETEGSHTD